MLKLLFIIMLAAYTGILIKYVKDLVKILSEDDEIDDISDNVSEQINANSDNSNKNGVNQAISDKDGK